MGSTTVLSLYELLTGFVAGVELFFFALLFNGWQKPWGLKITGLTTTQAKSEANMAANLGLSHAFLATGCLSSVVVPDPLMKTGLGILFLTFVFLYGIYGGLTLRRWFIALESLPALIGLILLWVANPLVA